ncbi:unnamed protein product [Calypogeia fissa]
METRRKDLTEGANYNFTRQQRSSFAAAWEGYRQQNRNSNNQRKPVMGSQVGNHDQCNNHCLGSEAQQVRDSRAKYSISQLEARLAGMAMSEWWGTEKMELTRQSLWESVNGGKHNCFADDGMEVRSRQGRLNSAVNGGEQCFGTEGEERKRAQNTTTRGGLLDAGLSFKSMKEWWTSLSASIGNKRSLLHQEILNFCKANEMTPEQTHARRTAQGFLEFTVLQIWSNAEVHLYGSTAMDLALPTSDIDIVVVMQPATQTSAYGRPFPDTGPYVTELYSKLLKMDPDMFQSLTQIPHAKVPILKAVFRSGLACDISFDWQDNRPGQGVQLVRQYLKQYKALKPLILVLKSFLRKHKLNEVFTGGIGSFCLTIMVVNLLENVGSEASAASQDLGALLVSFFMYYSCLHNYVTDVVSTRPWKSLSKPARGWVNWSDPERLAVENPLDPSSDVGSGSYNIHDVRVKFSQARRVLLRHWDEENLLDRIFKPCIT